jgi:hypothetical protein
MFRTLFLTLIIVAVFHQLFEKIFPHDIIAFLTVGNRVLCRIDPYFLYDLILHGQVPLKAAQN